MAVEAIQKVTQVEQEEKRRKDAAAAENKQKLQNAQRDAQRLLEQARAPGGGQEPNGAGPGGG